MERLSAFKDVIIRKSEVNKPKYFDNRKLENYERTLKTYCRKTQKSKVFYEIFGKFWKNLISLKKFTEYFGRNF